MAVLDEGYSCPFMVEEFLLGILEDRQRERCGTGAEVDYASHRRRSLAPVSHGARHPVGRLMAAQKQI
jgi:hypothetical protein